MSIPVDHADRHRPGGIAFWTAMGIGGAVVAFGAAGLVSAEGNGLSTFAPWFAGGALAMDLVIVPAAAGLGALGRRVVPPVAWPPVRAALVATATLTLVAAPLVANLGGRPDNASLRPRDYGTGLLASIAACWLLALVVIVGRLASRRARDRVR